jgi:hypothetical protein
MEIISGLYSYPNVTAVIPLLDKFANSVPAE